MGSKLSKEIGSFRDILPVGTGYSLLSVVIALAIFLVGILSIVSLLPGGQKAVKTTLFSNYAATLAERELARIRACYSDMESPAPPPFLSGCEANGYRWEAQIEGGPVYTVTLTVSYQDEGDLEREEFLSRFTRR